MSYDYSYNLNSADLSTASIASLSAFLGAYMIVILAIVVLQIIAMWKIFTKAGEKGWKSIIPIYSTVILFKISGLSPWLILIYLASFIPIAGPIAIIALTAVLAYKLAKSFGKDGAWAVGIFFLSVIFYMILGFGGSTYVGPGGESAQPKATE